MANLGYQPGLLPRTIGHGFGIVGAMFGMDAIATAVNPHFVSLFPFQAGGIDRDIAAVVSLAFIAVAAWLVWASDYRRRKMLAAISRRQSAKHGQIDDKADH
jgi:hypothetical protein